MALPNSAGSVLPPGRSERNDANAAGFLLASLKFEPIRANDAAVQILGYPELPQRSSWSSFAQQRIRSILKSERFMTGTVPEGFISGRRRYVCRPFLLHSSERPSMVAVLLERTVRDSVDLTDISRRFHLSRREGETVLYLMRGLSTKEVAQRMSISPNTVKQFVRLTMSKMRVTTRLGIISRVVSDRFEKADHPE